MLNALKLAAQTPPEDPASDPANAVHVRVSPARAALRSLIRSPGGLFGACVGLVLIALAVLAPWLPIHDPLASDLAARMQPPTLGWTQIGAHPLGTDELGRDLLARIIFGARVTLSVGFYAVVVGGVTGVMIGVVAGYVGGFVERAVMRLADIQLALPIMLLAMLIVAALGPSLHNLIVVLALTSWVRYARIVRGQVLLLRHREFVMAAHSVGASHLRIMWRHILPNVVTPAVIVGTLELGRLIVMEASLSFLGLGIQPPNADWGLMLAQGRVYLSSAWWVSTFPGIAIVVTVLAANLLGDWLRDHFDPRMRTR